MNVNNIDFKLVGAKLKNENFSFFTLEIINKDDFCYFYTKLFKNKISNQELKNTYNKIKLNKINEISISKENINNEEIEKYLLIIRKAKINKIKNKTNNN